MRKYLFNTGFISSVVSGVGVAKATANGPRDWRLALLWASWGIGVALAIGSVIEQNKMAELEDDARELNR
ncbi:hypothetical protein [Humidisolicoccus flavus]|uniref:hypothetical protein n=1 Tax=Humidisolicoccus flavus TaxID=3111414 RepID=UPI0032513EC8